MLTILFAAVVIGQHASVFADDSALSVIRELRCEAETVGEFLDLVSEKQKIRLQASPDVRDDALILYSKAPVRETLERIAKHFDWTWEKDRDGYVLKQTATQKNAENLAREDQILRPYLIWQSDARRALLEFKIGDPSLRQKLDLALEEMATLRETYDSEYYSGDRIRRDAWVKKSREVENEMSALGHSLSRTWLLADTIVSHLTRGELLELDRVTKIVFGIPSTSWQTRMSPDAVRAADALASTWRSLQPQTATTMEWELSNLLRAPERLNDNSEPAVGVRASVKIDLNRPQPADTFLRTPILISMLDRNGVTIGQSSIFPESLRRQNPPAQPLPREKGSLDDKLVPTEELKAAIETDDAGNLKGSITGPEFLKSDSRSHPVRPMARVLIEVVAAAKKNLISDVYDSRLYWTRKPLPTTSAGATLDAATQASGQKWNLESDWVTMRSEYWQLRRHSTVKPPLLFRIRDVMKPEPTSFDAFASVVSQLTDRQLEARNISGLMFEKWAEYFHPSNRATLWVFRFWGSLQPVEKKRLLAEERMRYGSLSARQQECVRMFVLLSDRENYRSEFVSPSRAKLGLEGEDYDWKKRSWPGYPEEAIHRETEPTAQLPNGIPFDAQIGMRHTIANALLIANSQGWKRPMSEGEVIESGYFKPSDAGTFSAAPTIQNRYTFTVWCTPTLTKGVQFGVFDPPKGDPKPFSELPKEIVDRLERAQKLKTGGG